jgi:hypothetical protein
LSLLGAAVSALVPRRGEVAIDATPTVLATAPATS